MKVTTYDKGPLGANLYAIEHNGRFLIVDPCVNPAKVGFEDKLDLVEAVLITHGHFDHITAVDLWNSAPVYIHPLDFESFTNPRISLVSDFGLSDTYKTIPKDIMSINGSIFLGDESNGVRLTVIHTPGHCPGQVLIVLEDVITSEKVMFSGDMLFAGAIGRFDFRTSSASDMSDSISVIKSLDISCKVYPGHGPATTLDIEKRTNPYF